MKTVYSFITLSIILITLIACDTANKEEEKTFVLSGSIEGPQDAGKKNVYLALFKAGTTDFLTADPIVKTSIILDANAEGEYSVSGIKKGKYSAAIFIDMDSDGELSEGDYYTYMTSGVIPGYTSPGDITIDKNLEFDIPSEVFIEFEFEFDDDDDDYELWSEIYFKKPSDWGTVYVHYWNDKGETEWPGKEMEQYSGDWYKITITEVESGNFSNYVFNNGTPIYLDDQTIDTEWSGAIGWCTPKDEGSLSKSVKWTTSKP